MYYSIWRVYENTLCICDVYKNATLFECDWERVKGNALCGRCYALKRSECRRISSNTNSSSQRLVGICWISECIETVSLENFLPVAFTLLYNLCFQFTVLKVKDSDVFFKYIKMTQAQVDAYFFIAIRYILVFFFNSVQILLIGL